jgi:hypothetical protein
VTAWITANAASLFRLACGDGRNSACGLRRAAWITIVERSTVPPNRSPQAYRRILQADVGCDICDQFGIGYP